MDKNPVPVDGGSGGGSAKPANIGDYARKPNVFVRIWRLLKRLF